MGLFDALSGLLGGDPEEEEPPQFPEDVAAIADPRLEAESEYLDRYRATVEDDDETVEDCIVLALPTDRLSEGAREAVVEAFQERREVWAKGRSTPGVLDVVAGGDEPIPWLAHRGEFTRLTDCGDLPVRTRLAVLTEVAAAFDNMEVGNHRHWGLVPEHLWVVDPDGAIPEGARADLGEYARVSDWGLDRDLRVAAGEEPITPYDAPEQLAPEEFEDPDSMDAYFPDADVDTTIDLKEHHGESEPWVDSYRFGAVAYHVLTGDPPFSPGDDLRSAILDGEVPPPSEADPRVPSAVDGLVARLTHEDLSRRPMVAWVVEDLAELFEATEPE